jgi:hypothetical protein
MDTSFLTYTAAGAVAASIVTMFTSYKIKSKEIRTKALEEKISNLYGPIYFKAKSSELYFKHIKDIHDGYTKHYVIPEFSREELTQQRLSKADSDSMNIKQKYQEIIYQNNQKIKSIIDESFHLIDFDDLEVFLSFNMHINRLTIEAKNGDEIRLPTKIQRELEPISLLPDDFSLIIKKKYSAYKKELHNLTQKQWYQVWK